jgi:membrane protein DedA with SNARE-associated domain
MDIISILWNLIQNNSYLIIFILMLIQGPIITAIAAFMASLGILNIYYILLLAFFGNLIPDMLFFLIGKHSRRKSVENLICRLGFNKSRLLFLERNLKNHLKKAVILIKITPFIPLPGIMLAGFLKIPFKKFFSISILVDIVTISIAAFIGYYSGVIGGTIIHFFRLEKYLLPLFVIFIFILAWLIKVFYLFVVKNIKKLI